MNKQKNNDQFGFWTPITLKKAKSEDGEEKMILGGIASTIDVDADGESLDPSGFIIDDFSEIGLVNWHHQAKDQPATVIGEPILAELRPEGFYVEVELYKSSKVGRDVWELAKTLQKDSKNRRLGFSIEGLAVERGSEDETHPDFNIVKKAKITGLAVTHMPKNNRTFAEIIKGFISGPIAESEPTTESVSDEDCEKESGLSTKTGRPLIKESVDKKLKTLQKSYKVIELDENSTIDKIFETFTNINIQKAKNIFTILKAMSNKKVTNNQIEKAMNSLGLSMDEKNPFLIKAEEDNSEETATETSAQRKIRESGLTEEEIMSKVSEKLKLEDKTEDEDIDDEEGDEVIEKGVSNNLGRAAVKIISKKLEKAQSDNFNQNRALATLMKANAEQLQKAQESNAELKDIIAQQNRIMKGMIEGFSSQPQPRKSLVKSYAEKESFQKGKTEPSGNFLSMSKDYSQVLNLVDNLTFKGGGYDVEMSKATTGFESTKVLPQNIIARIKNEAGVTIID